MADNTNKTRFSGKRVALGVSGGIAAYKAAEVLRGLQRAGCTVRVAMSKRACEFVQPLTFRALSGSHVVVDDYGLEDGLCKRAVTDYRREHDIVCEIIDVDGQGAYWRTR